MLRAGIAWDADGYECAVVDPAGALVGEPVRFAGRQLLDLVGYLRGYGADLAAVVDSTNGMVDASLLAVGVSVYRADPPELPDRPPFGSVPAVDVARVDRSLLTELSIETGTITGLAATTWAAVEASAPVEERLAARGRFAGSGRAGRPEVALTFDDGPDPRFTGVVLDILARYGVPATFFCVGMNAAGHPELVERAAAAGHGLGNHLFSHPYIPDLTRDELLRQVDATGAALARVTGTAPPLLRPPYGARTPEALTWLDEHGATTVIWDVDPQDWARPGPDAICRAALAGVRPGSIVLLHDGGGDRSHTVEALPAIVEGVLERGYRPVTVDRILT
jgi:peptidoglycan/xylan/chitin deacetylase (PgdA/CDA1 family)